MKNVLSRFYSGLEVATKEVESDVPPQPVGLAATIRGAINRAKRALEAEQKAELGVGVEAGLIEVPYSLTGFMDQQFAAIADRKGYVTIGGGPSFEYPSCIISEVIAGGIEVGAAMEKLTGIKDLGKKQGAIGYFSHGALDRLALTELAVLMAMIPRLNSDLYLRGDR